MARCNCGAQTCSCVITSGPNVTVDGAGTPGNPYVISASGGGAGEAMTGEIRGWGGASAPPGWLMANGAPISRTTYADLFAIYGTLYGSGDGSTTFNLPDLAGRFPIGSDGSTPLGSSGGSQTKVITAANLPAHTHTINHTHAAATTSTSGNHDHNLIVSPNDGTGNRLREAGAGGVLSNDEINANGNHTHTVNVPAFNGASGSTGSGTPMNIMPPYTAINWIVKS